jgi:hypothetical protein
MTAAGFRLADFAVRHAHALILDVPSPVPVAGHPL